MTVTGRLGVRPRSRSAAQAGPVAPAAQRLEPLARRRARAGELAGPVPPLGHDSDSAGRVGYRDRRRARPGPRVGHVTLTVTVTDDPP